MMAKSVDRLAPGGCGLLRVSGQHRPHRARAARAGPGPAGAAHRGNRRRARRPRRPRARRSTGDPLHHGWSRLPSGPRRAGASPPSCPTDGRATRRPDHLRRAGERHLLRRFAPRVRRIIERLRRADATRWPWCAPRSRCSSPPRSRRCPPSTPRACWPAPPSRSPSAGGRCRRGGAGRSAPSPPIRARDRDAREEVESARSSDPPLPDLARVCETGSPRTTRRRAACGSSSPRRRPASRRSTTRRRWRWRSAGAGSTARASASTRPGTFRGSPRGAPGVSGPRSTARRQWHSSRPAR